MWNLLNYLLSKWLIILLIILVPYTVFFSINQINQHKLSLNLVGFDMGQFNQCLYNAVHGRSPTTTIGIEAGEGPRSLHLFRKHLYPIFLLLLPIYYIFPSYQVLLVIYVLFFAVSPLLLYLISVKETGRYKIIAAEAGDIILKRDMPPDYDDSENKVRALAWLNRTLQLYINLYEKVAESLPRTDHYRHFFNNLEIMRRE